MALRSHKRGHHILDLRHAQRRHHGHDHYATCSTHQGDTKCLSWSVQARRIVHGHRHRPQRVLCPLRCRFFAVSGNVGLEKSGSVFLLPSPLPGSGSWRFITSWWMFGGDFLMLNGTGHRTVPHYSTSRQPKGVDARRYHRSSQR
jgi:hypothetical protein